MCCCHPAGPALTPSAVQKLPPPHRRGPAWNPTAAPLSGTDVRAVRAQGGLATGPTASPYQNRASMEFVVRAVTPFRIYLSALRLEALLDSRIF